MSNLAHTVSTTCNTVYNLLNLMEDLKDSGVDISSQMFQYFCETDLNRLATWRRRLEVVRSYRYSGEAAKSRVKKKVWTKKERMGKQSSLKGKVSEALIRTLLNGCKVLRCGDNVRSTTSEIDFLIFLQPTAKYFQFLGESRTHLLGEAKCYDKGPKKEWVDEMAGTTDTHGTDFGILFTLCPPRKIHSDMRYAIGLHGARGKTILPLGFTQIDKVLKGENFLQVLSDQYVLTSVHSSDLWV